MIDDEPKQRPHLLTFGQTLLPPTTLSLASWEQWLRALFGFRIFRFLIVGGLGFCVDAAVLLIATSSYGFDPYSGRIVSFVIGMTFTWMANRHLTFAAEIADKSGGTKAFGAEAACYFLVSTIGACVNYGVYAQMVSLFALDGVSLIIGVVCGSIAGLSVNFFGYKHWVFAKKKTQLADEPYQGSRA